MFNCPNCGKSLPDDSVYCEGCGNHVSKFGTVQPVAQPTVTPKKKGKGLKVFFAGVIAVIVVIIAFSTFISKCSSSAQPSDTTTSNSATTTEQTASPDSVNPYELYGTWESTWEDGYRRYVFYKEYCIFQYSDMSDGVTYSYAMTWSLSGSNLELNVPKELEYAIGVDTHDYKRTFANGTLSYVTSNNQKVTLEKVSDDPKDKQHLTDYLGPYNGGDYTLNIDYDGYWTLYENGTPAAQTNSVGVWFYIVGSSESYAFLDGITPPFEAENGAMILFYSNGEIVEIIQMDSNGAFSSLLATQ